MTSFDAFDAEQAEQANKRRYANQSTNQPTNQPASQPEQSTANNPFPELTDEADLFDPVDLELINSDTAPTSDLALIDPDLTDIVTELGEIQAELHYRQAQDVLHELVERLDLSARERSGLEVELHSLERMLDKLDRQVIQIAVFGMVGRGKSSLLNALLGQDIFETGPIHGVTQTVQTAEWSVTRESVAGSTNDLWRVSLPGAGHSRIELIDTPGIDEIDGESREALARRLAKQADLILFVVAGDITKVEFEALSELRQASKPILLVFNKIDQYPQADRQAIYEKIRDERVRELLSPDEIVMAAASPLVAQAMRRSDGQLVAQLHRGSAQVEDLKLKILEILHREGKSLVALNTMLYADDIHEQVVQRKMAIREHSAEQIIWNTVMTKAVAIALNPVTVLDLFSSAVIDGAMILTLSRLYGISMTQQDAIQLLRKILISMGGVTATELLGILGLGSLKGFLGLSAPATGGVSLLPYMTIALTQAGIGGLASYSIGQVSKTYLANGATWGPNGPKAVVDQILASLDETSILNRIKDELKAKLESQHWSSR
ncbi:GTP-binding protein [Leptolyngbya sp. NK1-12]|uniref:GTP-binding protein n=1 Tax=Leptolyngbya sp. NK1-12 TaxID=2547451 RepID=UPI002931A7D8|nr:GTP-binding protein [Leptolyngbya sp. NK1-12]